MAQAADFTIADVLAWASTKPADERYNFTDAGKCAVAQFGRATGRSHLVNLLSGQLDRACPNLLSAVLALGAEATFGKLVERLEALCPETPPSEWTRLDAYMTDIELASA